MVGPAMAVHSARHAAVLHGRDLGRFHRTVRPRWVEEQMRRTLFVGDAVDCNVLSARRLHLHSAFKRDRVVARRGLFCGLVDALTVAAFLCLVGIARKRHEAYIREFGASRAAQVRLRESLYLLVAVLVARAALPSGVACVRPGLNHAERIRGGGRGVARSLGADERIRPVEDVRTGTAHDDERRTDCDVLNLHIASILSSTASAVWHLHGIPRVGAISYTFTGGHVKCHPHSALGTPR